MSRPSPAKLRVAGLGTAVAIAVLVPFAAKAGPSAEAPPPAAAPAPPLGDAKPGDAKPGGAGGLLDGLGLGRQEDPRPASGAGADPDAPAPASARPPVRTPARAPARAGGPAGAATGAPERVSRCGPELASPEGVEAQTCVLSEGPDVWARTYYRNATRRGIDAILTLMAPGGRTVQVRCAVPARDEPGTCETPREPGTGTARAHTAVAEFAAGGEGGDAPLLLRSGSNTAGGEAS
ncbi:hypothetical protein [Streptomyces griseus]|uniref:hypothetical protein n=1 Tax=Streptomyces griseus TaxID=1911 RepID=UPI0004C5D918|nr:hypothetical protein [Streptomyces griseus]